MKTVCVILTILVFSFNSLNSQTHLITIHPNQRVISLEMTPTEYSNWINNDEFSQVAPMAILVREIYQKFNDEFDFIFFVLNEDNVPSTIPYSGKCISASNHITGIGRSIMDNTSNYGSSGRLKSIIHLPQKTFILYGPALHELMHTWANFGIKTSGFNGTPISDYRSHWGFTGGNTRGQLGGFTQISLQTGIDGNPNKYKVDPFGQVANGGNGVPYSEMELYLMGMIPSSNVTPFDVFRDINSFDINTYQFEANTRVTYDETRILSELGTRSPSNITSQKDFRLLIVVLTDAPLSTSEWDLYDSHSELFSRNSSDGISYLYNFWEASGGRGTLETGNLNNAIKLFTPGLSVAPSSITVASTSGATGNFNVNSNTSWSVIDDAAWLNLSSASGTGNGTITVTTNSTNTSTSPRSANVTFSASGVSSVIVTVTQSGAGPTLSVAPSSITVASTSGASGNFNVTSNTSWSVIDDAVWLNLSSASGTGNGTITVTTNSVNTSTSPRSANVTFSASGVSPIIVIVTQSGAGPTLSVTPPTITVTSTSGASGNFNVTSNTSWSVIDDAAWLNLSSASGTGNGPITITTTSANTSTSPRSANVTFSASGVTSVIVTIIQDGTGPTLSVSPSSLTVASTSGASGNFNVTSNTSWTVTENSSWFNLSSGSGSGNGPITITTTSANTSTSPRSANVTFSASGVTSVIVTVIQDGTDPTLSVSPPSINVASTSGATGNFNVTSNTSWTVTENSSWFNLSSGSGSGNGPITVTTTSANTSTSPRSANVTFSASGVSSVIVTITQDGTGPTLSVAPPSMTVASTSGATGNFNVTSNTSWTVIDNATWLNLSSASGTGNGTLTVTTASSNSSSSPRTANVTFSASGVNSVIVTVTQNGSGNDQNLIAHYPLILNASDITGNYTDMTLINTPFTNGGIYCNGIYENQGLCDAHTPTIDQISYDKLTFYVEFMIEQYPTYYIPVIVAGAGSHDRWLGFSILSNGHYSINADNFTKVAESSTTCTLNVWHSAAITYDSPTNTGKLYIDGSLACEGIFTLNLLYAHKSLGMKNYSNTMTFKGYLKNIKIYKDVISNPTVHNNEIKNLAINIFPNPVHGNLTIEYKDDNYKSINILNSLGILLGKEKVVSPRQQLDFSRYEYGIYILEFVKPDGGVKRVKVVNH
jgi:Secretion system C-terminal sorting domain/Viral BACON domain/Putative binding domain, N-terminal